MKKYPSIILSLLFSVMCVEAERHAVNQNKVPHTQADLLEIEKALKSNLSRTMAATVCVTDGQGSGTGVIVDETGLVLTAAHVSAGIKKKLTIIMPDGTELEAKSLGLDSSTDAAMVQIINKEKKKFPYVEIDQSSKTKSVSSVRLGDWVYSLGHSGGFDKSRGIVVRLGRIVRISDSTSTFQSDCKLIGGDSGGPLFDMNGVLIGIHSRVGVVLNQNNHVSIDDFIHKWDDLKKGTFMGNEMFAQRPPKGEGFIGIAVKAADKGLEITEIDPESPAKEAGLEVGDILLEVNDKKVSSREEMKKIMSEYAQGDLIKLKLLSKGSERVVELDLGER